MAAKGGFGVQWLGTALLALELTPSLASPRLALGCQPGTSLGEGGGDAADPTLTFTVEAETCRTPGHGVP